MPNGYQEMLHGMDPSINPAGVEAHLRLQYGTLDHLDAATFHKELALARNTEHLHPGYMREAAEAEAMTKDFNHWQTRLEPPPPTPPCVICGLPAVDMDSVSTIPPKELLPALSEESAASLTTRWQRNPTLSPAAAHLSCIQHPELLPWESGAFQKWTVARLNQLQIHGDIRR